MAYEATPAAGKVDEITSFAITYKDFEKIEINNEAGRIQLIGNRMTEEGWPLTMFMVVNDIQIDGNTLNLARKATITEPGNYTLYIPGGVRTGRLSRHIRSRSRCCRGSARQNRFRIRGL